MPPPRWSSPLAFRPTPAGPPAGGGRDTPRVCIDVQPPPADMVAFAELAIEENPTNAPALVGVHELPRTPMSMALVTSKKWEVGRRLRVAFLDGPKAGRDMVTRVAPEWSKYANLSFEFDADPKAAEIRVSFRQQGAWSYIGTDALGIPKSKPTMNFGFYDRATILHEFGHAIGGIHEHQHPAAGIPWDREKVYKFYAGPPNYWSRNQVDVNLFQRYATTVTQFSRYDPKSILHYPVDPRLTVGGFKVDWNRELSETDKSYVATVYPGVYAPSPAVAPAALATSSLALPLSGEFHFSVIDGKPTIVLSAKS